MTKILHKIEKKLLKMKNSLIKHVTNYLTLLTYY